jgi:hypothetical protein
LLGVDRVHVHRQEGEGVAVPVKLLVSLGGGCVKSDAADVGDAAVSELGGDVCGDVCDDAFKADWAVVVVVNHADVLDAVRRDWNAEMVRSVEVDEGT